MGKDNTKYRYVESAILRGSETLESLEDDAMMHHIPDHLGIMQAMRIADYYRIAKQVGTYSVEGILAALQFAAVSPAASVSTVLPEPEPIEEVGQSVSVSDNVSAADDYWSKL